MLSFSKRFIARTLLCASIIGLSAQGQHAISSQSSPGLSTRSSIILCQPPLVFRCNSKGCFCVAP